MFPGSGPPARFAAAAYHDTILDKRTLGLTAQRICPNRRFKSAISARARRSCSRSCVFWARMRAFSASSCAARAYRGSSPAAGTEPKVTDSHPVRFRQLGPIG
jgi:hypothetical protein